MSLRPEKLPEIPEETARIAKILFPKRINICGYAMNSTRSTKTSNSPHGIPQMGN